VSTARRVPEGIWQAIVWRVRGWGEWIDDHANPIVVKELRQAIKGRFLGILLLLFLLVQLVVLGASLLSESARASTWISTQMGRNYFRFLLVILQGACLFFIPMYSALRLIFERSSRSTDLMFVSTLTPLQIINGKTQAAWLYTLLMCSACAPFMAISYLLRGIDFMTIFALLGLVCFLVFIAIQAAIFAACLTRVRLFRWGLMLVVAAGLVGAFITGMEVAKKGIQLNIGRNLFTKQNLSGVASLVVFGVFLAGLLRSLSVALISNPSTNRAFRVRAYYTSGWCLTLVVVLLSTVLSRSRDFLGIWLLFHTGLLCVGSFVVVGERESLGSRLQRMISSNLWVRLVSFPLFGGAASGLTWLFGMMLMTVGTVAFFYSFSYDLFGFQATERDWIFLKNCVVWMMFAVSYAVTGMFLRRFLFRKIDLAYTWTLGLLLFSLSGLVPVLLCLVTGAIEKAWGMGLVLTPFALSNHEYKSLAKGVALAWGSVAIMLTAPYVLFQMRDFRPYLKLDGPVGPEQEG
jgi:hypothetical protein